MLTIRFSRIGKRRKAFFRVIVSEKSKDTRGDYLELLGHYNPHTKQTSLKTERIQYWLSKGATMSNSIHNFLANQGIIKADDKRKSVFISKKRAASIADRKQKEAAAAAKPEPKAEASEVPAES